MSERMEIEKSLYGGFLEPHYKNILEQMLTVMVTAGKWWEMPTCQKLTPR